MQCGSCSSRCWTWSKAATSQRGWVYKSWSNSSTVWVCQRSSKCVEMKDAVEIQAELSEAERTLVTRARALEMCTVLNEFICSLLSKQAVYQFNVLQCLSGISPVQGLPCSLHTDKVFRSSLFHSIISYNFLLRLKKQSLPSMTFVCSVPSEAEWWALTCKCRVVTPAESELQGGHTAIILEKLLCHIHCPWDRHTTSFPWQLPGGNCGDGVCKWELHLAERWWLTSLC